MSEKPTDRIDWEDASTVITAGSSDAYQAAWYLTGNRLGPLMRSARYGPIVLGVVLACIVAAIVLFTPSAESHFIYTDF
ncbi:MAG: hypothetical protein M3R30_10870 [Candidatus Eremiobacteraeota bacterium]|nr:hypothetical protein [Candidatus Eremiobacteraeota bacterium]